MTKILGHRGFSGAYPENTMLAFKEALKLGADGIETDVQMSKDGVLCLMHDETIDRTTDGHGRVCDMTWDQLKKINVNCRVSDGHYGFCGIPTLEEFLLLIKETDSIANLELKNSKIYYPELEEKTIEMIRAIGVEKNIIISSFNNPSVMKCRDIAPEIECGFLYGGSGIEHAGLYCSEMGVKYYHPEYKHFTQKDKDECDKYGIGANLWTVNDRMALRNLMSMGVNSVITNYPDYALEVREELKK